MKADAEDMPSRDQATGTPDAIPAWQRALEADGWFGLVLPGVLALTFILIVFLAVMAGDRALVASARETNGATLQAILASTMQRFEEWAGHQERNAAVWAHSELVRDALEELLETPVESSLAAAPAQSELRATLGPWLTEYGYRGFFVMGANGVNLASLRNSDLGRPSATLGLVDIERLQRGRAILTRPQIVDTPALAGDPEWAGLDEEVVMYAIAAITVDDVVRGYFALRIDPLAEYSSTFRVGRIGMSGETYAVDRNGRLISETRYASDYRTAGLLAQGHPSMLHLEIRNPGVNLTRGAAPSEPYSSWPLTAAAQAVTDGARGANLTGYRDARGVRVMGAWAWDPVREIGAITEIDVDEALAGVNRARAVMRVFAVAMALCFIAIAVMFNIHRSVSRRRTRQTLEATQRFRRILMTVAEGIYGVDQGAEEFFWTKAGVCVPVEFSKSWLEAGNPSAGSVVTIRDITRRRRDELALLRYAQELKRSNAELQEFAYAASHDLQEPLRKIQAFGERLHRKYHDALDETGQHYLDRMVDAASRMRRLIDDLLGYSRVNSKSTAFEPVDLTRVLADVLSDLEPRIVAEGASVRVGTLPAIEADQGQMHQLFLNLLSNSMKFHRPGVDPSILVEGAVEVGEGGAVARISVTDNGIGFEARHAERIFGMFERLHGREEYDGTGVGLATCRKIVEHHSGILTAWAEPDSGAVFTIILPIRQTVDR